MAIKSTMLGIRLPVSNNEYMLVLRPDKDATSFDFIDFAILADLRILGNSCFIFAS